MQDKKEILAPATVTIKNESCTSDGMGNCTVIATVEIVYGELVTLMNPPDAMVGSVTADVTEPSAPVEDPPGTFTHTFAITADVTCGQQHSITAKATFVVGVNATPVSVNCP